MTSVGVADAYERAAGRWHQGPERVYGRLADALLSVSPVPVAGIRVLDVGAGTAVAGRAALALGAGTVVATDLAAGMLRYRGAGIGAVCSDLARLPFGDRAFDLVLAAFCLGHVPDPGRALAETRRVGPVLLASAFDPDSSHPAREIVDRTMTGFGFVVPAWYATVKSESEPAVNDAAGLADLAREAGYADVLVHRIAVDSGLASPTEIVDWRLGMAHLAPFVNTLPTDVLQQARQRAELAVTGLEPVTIGMLALSAS